MRTPNKNILITSFFLLVFLLIQRASFSQCTDLTPQFTVSQNSFCGAGPHSVALTNTSNGPDAATANYEWLLNGTTFDNTTGLVNPNNSTLPGPGTYTVELIASGGPPPCTESTTTVITVFPQPNADFSFAPDNACAGVDIDFSNLSTNTNGGTTFTWDFGDGNTSNQENPTHVYASGGSYTVTLTVENAPGCSSNFSLTVTALDIPDVAISGDDGDGNLTNCLLPGDPTVLNTVDFLNSTTGATSYFWDFGDGNAGTGFEPTHTYNTYGTFDVVMTATGSNGCTASDTIEVVFEKFVSASLNLDVTEYSGCAPFALTTLQNNSNNANSFVWDFGDGTPPYTTTNQTPPNHIYIDAGTYTISLTASNSCNSANATISPIVIVDKPEIDFTTAFTAGCAPETGVSFTNNSVGASPANDYEWDMGNGNTYTTTVTPPNQDYLNAGTYTISLTGSNACGDSTLTQNIVLDTVPTASIDVDPMNECSPETFTFDNFSSANTDNYSWYLDGAVYSNDSIINPITFTYPPGNTPVEHEVILEVSNACGTDLDTVEITVHRPTDAQFNISAPNSCLGDPVTFTNNSLGENLTYEWDFGNGTTSTNAGPHTINYASPGNYTVQLIASGYCGPDTIVQTVTVNPLTVADFQPLDPIEGCSPVTVSFENNSTGTNLSYNWTVDGNPAGTTTDLGPITFTETPGNAPVNHVIELSVTSTCGVETMQTTVIVHRPTQADMTVTPSEVCIGDPFTFTDQSLGENLSWEWDLDDGTTLNTQGPHTYTYTADGTYNVQLIADGYCGPDTVETTVVVHPYPVADFNPDLPEGCAVFETTFTNNSTTTANQSWDFGPNATPSTSTDFNPGIITFPVDGTEMIVLQVEENGCVSTDTNYVNIYPIPVVDFTVTPDEGCSVLDVSITNNSVDTGVETFTWDFDNGTTLNGYNAPDQSYFSVLNDTIYDIQLNVESGNGCEDSLIVPVTVHPLPTADFEFLNDSICLNELMEVDNLSTPGMSYEWDFGDGNTSTAFAPTHQFSAAGTYTVELIATSPFSCADTTTRVFVVHPIPDAQFANSTECLGYQTAFTDNSTGNIVGWSWDFGDGNLSTQQNPLHEYISSGTYNATLTVENDLECFDDITQTVTVNDVPEADFSAANFCLGDNTQFTDLTSGATTQLEWNFDDGSPVSNATNPSHVFPATGTYDVQLVAFGGSGCSDTTVQTITITGVPTADFSFQTVCATDTTFFTDLSTGTPDTYSWDFDDGSTSSLQNPDHVYNTAGTYNVSLTVSYTSSGCSNTITYAVDAHPRTTPQFVANTPCLGSETDFIDQTGNSPILWEWDFDDGNTSTAQNPSHEYLSPGIYDVNLITENVFGCSDTLVQSVEVYELPTPDFTFDTVCLNAVTSIIDQSQNAVDWEYDFGDGTIINGQNPTHTYASDGTFTVSQVVTNIEGCSDTLEHDVIVRPNPTALWQADTACFSYLTSFTDNSVDAITWDWNFGDMGATSTQQNPQHVYSADGTYNAELIVANAFGCTDTLNEAVLVQPQPIADFNNATVCAGNAVDFTNTSQGNPILFNWDFDDGSPVSTNENPTHTFATGGFYDIEFIAENNVGCADTLVEQIEVFTVPDVDFEADTVCLFDITNFTDLTQDPTPLLSWDWDFGDGNTSFQQNPSYIYQNPGTYDVALTVTNNNGCDSTINQDVIVSQVPEADFTVQTDCFGAPTQFTDQSTNNPGIWLWDFGDGTTINGGPNETHTYAAPGNYVVTLDVLGSDSICSDQAVQVVTVNQQAQADFFIPSQICATETFNFTDNSSTNLGNITSYEWDMGDGSIYTTANGTHNYATDGIYTVTLTITTTNGCQSTYSESIEVFPITVADFDWSLACEGQSILFTNTSTGNTTDWFWDFDDGTTSSNQNPTHTFNSPGSYNVRLIVQNLAGCPDTIVNTVEVHPTPVANFASNNVCYGEATSFSDLSTLNSGNIANWEWQFENGNTSNDQNPNYTFSNYTAQHDVQLIVTSDQGCNDTIQKIAELLPIIDFQIAIENSVGCAPVEVLFDNQSSLNGANITNYSWNFDDGSTSFQQTPTHLFDSTGTYNVSLTISTDTDCQFINDSSITIEVFPKPQAGFDASPSIVSITDPVIEVTDESNGANSWEYELSDGNYYNAPNFNHTFNGPGEFFITQFISNEYGCLDTTRRAVRVKDQLNLYVPNSFTPNNDGKNDVFKWEVTGSKHAEMRIFNRWGEEIFNAQDPTEYWDGSYTGETVRDGVYIWQVKIIDLNGDEQLYTGHVSVIR